MTATQVANTEDDFDAAAQASDLGFSFDPPQIPGAPALPVTLSDADYEIQLTESIRQKALVRVDIIAENLFFKAADPAATTKTLVDALDANYKLSGLAAKNALKEALATAVSITINMPSQGSLPRVVQGTVIEQVPEAATPGGGMVDAPLSTPVSPPGSPPTPQAVTASFFAQPSVPPESKPTPRTFGLTNQFA